MGGVLVPPVWVPRIVFVNTPSTDLSMTDSSSSLYIKKQGKYSLSTLDKVEQVLFYGGSENPVNYRRKYTKSFSCDIRLNRFPFDSQVAGQVRLAMYVMFCQVCRITLELPSQLSGLVRLASGRSPTGF